MTSHRLIAAMCALILASALGPAVAQPADDAVEKPQGTWTAVRAQRDGTAAPDVVGHRLTFTNNRFQIRTKDGKPLYTGTIRVDTRAKPAAIDFEHTEGDVKGKTWKGIYTLKGDSLTVCDNAPNPDKSRPTALAAERGSGYVLITFQRAKP